jgi:nitrogen regulatory protein PII
MLKEITVILRPGKWGDTLKALEAAGFGGFTRRRVYGRGKQSGLRYGDGTGGIQVLPKWMLTLFAEESQVDALVKVILEANKTGEIGDGKIFVSPVGSVVRIRTNETGRLALE